MEELENLIKKIEEQYKQQSNEDITMIIYKNKIIIIKDQSKY